MTSVFLFAHQDDEIGVFHEISQTLQQGKALRCIYLTNGAWEGVCPQRRNDETIKALTSLGVQRQDIIFLGEQLDIHDGKLPEHLETALMGLLKIAKQITPPIERLIFHAWEGGHQDHDAVHLAGIALAHQLGIIDKSYQFPLYRMPAGRFRLTYATPLPENGKVISRQISWKQRIKYILMLRHYRSQIKVMIKLGLHMIWPALVDGTAKLQAVSLARIYQRPNTGIMLYEYWKLYTEQKFRAQTEPFLTKFMPPKASKAPIETTAEIAKK